MREPGKTDIRNMELYITFPVEDKIFTFKP
jgi:hypothetical protein